MYNRYLRSDEGVYTRIPMPDPPETQRERRPPPRPSAPPPESEPQREPIGREASQLLSHLLDKLPLKGVDKGDLLFLIILFFLFEEKADDELLIALGLLLIL